MRTYQQYPELANDILSRFNAIAWPHIHALEAGLKVNPNYDLDFALGKLLEAERLFMASKQGRVTVLDDTALMSREEYLLSMASIAGIHPNWPQHLLKTEELNAWITYYERAIGECNRAGYYLKAILKGHYYGATIQNYLTTKFNVQGTFIHWLIWRCYANFVGTKRVRVAFINRFAFNYTMPLLFSES